MTEPKAITICQPHAWAIVAGPKRYENRRWQTKYRGPLFIHAGTSREWLDRDQDDANPEDRQYPGCPANRDLVLGAIVGLVTVVDCIRPEAAKGDPYATGPWCHMYADPIAFGRPIPCPGQLNLWLIPDGILQLATAEAERVKALAGQPDPERVVPVTGPIRQEQPRFRFQ